MLTAFYSYFTEREQKQVKTALPMPVAPWAGHRRLDSRSERAPGRGDSVPSGAQVVCIREATDIFLTLFPSLSKNE